MAQAKDERWSGRVRGGRFGHLFIRFLIRSGLIGLTPIVLFFVVFWFLATAPRARRASFQLADRLARGGVWWRRLLFAYRHFFTFGTSQIDRTAVLSGRLRPYRFGYHHEELLHDQARSGQGAVLLTGHVCSWEIMAHMLLRVDKPVTLVMADTTQPAMKATLDRLAEGRSFRVLYTDGSPASAATIVHALNEGEFIGMMGDRVFGGEGVRVPFLGEDALFPVGPHAVAAAARVPVFHVFAFRAGRRRYDFYAYATGVPRYRDRRRKGEDHRRWVGEFAARLEEVVRRFPFEWANWYDFWAEGRDAD